MPKYIRITSAAFTYEFKKKRLTESREISVDSRKNNLYNNKNKIRNGNFLKNNKTFFYNVPIY